MISRSGSMLRLCTALLADRMLIQKEAFRFWLACGHAARGYILHIRGLLIFDLHC